GRSQLLAVGAERHAGDRVGVAVKGERFLTGRRVPNLQGLVIAPRDETPVVVAERESGDLERMSGQGEGLLLGCQIPDCNQAILTSQGQALAIVAERSAIYPVHGSAEGRDLYDVRC